MTSQRSEVDGLATLLDDVKAFIRRFVVLTDHQADAVTLWTAATHVPDAFDVAPYLDVTSPLKRCGKSRLLETLELLVRAPLSASTISTAALYRALDKKKPTLLLDEVDAIFTAKSDKDDLRGVINAGWRRSAVALRMGGPRMTKVDEFSPFGFKVLAGIGDLPDTIRDRCILIRLERRTREEQIERFRRRDVEPEGYELRDRLAARLEPQTDYLRSLRPNLPEKLDDRAQDLWEVLLAVADLADDDWPNRAETAAIAISTGEERDDDSLTALVLRDIHFVFAASGAERYRTADLIDELAKVEESPWGDWEGKGKPLSPQALGKLLKLYRIKTMPVWVDAEKHRGYKREQFENAWARVLGGRSGRSGRSESPNGNASTTPTTSTALNANGRVPRAGDPGFPPHVDIAYLNGDLTALERVQGLALHRLIRSVPEQPPPLSDAEVEVIAASLEEEEEELLS